MAMPRPPAHRRAVPGRVAPFRVAASQPVSHDLADDADSVGGDSPTSETPPSLIESTSNFVHDAGVEQLANLAVDAVLDPVVLGSTVVVTAVLVSGLAARLFELGQDHLPTLTALADSRGTKSSPHQRREFTMAPSRSFDPKHAGERTPPCWEVTPCSRFSRG